VWPQAAQRGCKVRLLHVSEATAARAMRAAVKGRPVNRQTRKRTLMATLCRPACISTSATTRSWSWGHPRRVRGAQRQRARRRDQAAPGWQCPPARDRRARARTRARGAARAGQQGARGARVARGWQARGGRAGGGGPGGGGGAVRQGRRRGRGPEADGAGAAAPAGRGARGAHRAPSLVRPPAPAPNYGAGAVEGLKQMAQALRRLPVVEPAVATVRGPPRQS